MSKLLPMGLALALYCGSACAALQICNENDETVFVAAGSEHDKAVTTLGWWEVPAGECRVINTGRVIIPTYVHAETQAIKLPGGGDVRDEWGKEKVLVVVRTGEKFERQNADKPKSGDDTARFADVTTALAGNVEVVTYAIRKGGSDILLKCKPDQKLTVRRVYPTKGYSCE
jgi:uncharacterized membrane protein